jgi:hypothetical protein
VLMAVFFAAGPSWATVCDLACARQVQTRLCPICDSPEHTAAHMHCAHMESENASGSAHAQATPPEDCRHLLCKHTASTSLPTRTFQSIAQKWSVIRQAAAFEVADFPIHSIGRAPPPRLADFSGPLTLALRI